MVSSKMRISKKLLPIKGHFFFFNAGTAPLVPYLSTYARQLGFSSATVGLIYTVLPIFGLIAKPLFGVIADRFKIQKSIFLLFQVVTLLSFLAIYFVPENRQNVSAQLDCDNGVCEIKSCFASQSEIDQCKLTTIGNTNETVSCDMNCDMLSPKMWQTVCEHWNIPEFCYSDIDKIEYTSSVKNVTVRNNCAFMTNDNVTLDGYTYTPHCGVGSNYVDINEPCTLSCEDEALSSAIDSKRPNMTCVDKLMNYRLCGNSSEASGRFTGFINKTLDAKCKAVCDLDKSSPWKLMEICEGWGADDAQTCKPRAVNGAAFPTNLSFVGSVRPWKVLTLDQCFYMQMTHIQRPDGSIHYPSNSKIFHTSCEISCNNTVVNEIIQEAHYSSNSNGTQYSSQFWVFFLFMTLSWVGMAVVVTFADAICFNLLGDKASSYGKQRLWGSVGWGIFSLATGALIDAFSEGAVKNYTVAFVLMAIFMFGDIAVSCLLKIESTKMSVNIIADVGSLFTSLPTFIYMMWTIVVGLCTGLLWQFLFWHLEDLAAQACDSSDYTKTLQGLVSAIQTFGGEIPFMFVSGYILKKIGHVNSMSLVLFAFGIRFTLYSYLTNAWWVLPIEMFQGITYGMFYPTMTSYANVVSPPGTETTVQGVVGAIFEGVGTSLGSLIGGLLYGRLGGAETFRWFGTGALVFCILHIFIQYLMKYKGSDTLNQGYESVIRYEQPNDTVFILEDMADGR
ncbi:hypothetical protein O0L34_g2818 [Tuta absoluta]|nr:hypothetical protein O0L34_g2818 [Tuta absoluta]